MCDLAVKSWCLLEDFVTAVCRYSSMEHCVFFLESSKLKTCCAICLLRYFECLWAKMCECVKRETRVKMNSIPCGPHAWVHLVAGPSLSSSQSPSRSLYHWMCCLIPNRHQIQNRSLQWHQALQRHCLQLGLVKVWWSVSKKAEQMQEKTRSSTHQDFSCYRKVHWIIDI